MLTQTDHKIPPALLVLVFQLNASRTARHPLGYRYHSMFDEDPRKDRRFPQPCVPLRGMRARPYACCDHRTGFFRIAQPKLQGRISAHAQADQMGAFDLKIPHHSSDVVDRELPAIQRCVFGDITRWVASGVVGNAAVAAGKMAKLELPPTVIRSSSFMNSHQTSVATLLEI